MPNKYTEIILSATNEIGKIQAPAIAILEKIVMGNWTTNFFFEVFNEDYFQDYVEEAEYKLNIYCLFAAMSDNDINQLINDFNKESQYV